MATIRTFREDDVDRVARLHQLVFPLDHGPASPETYRTYFHDTFLTGPWPDSGFRSLVCEESNGTLSGFLGVVPSRMVLGGRTLWATICTQFCVDPGRRGLTGLQLLRHHFAGPQDLSITDEAKDGTMRVWSWAGGEAVTSCSMHFVRPLRPARLALSVVARKAPDAIARHIPSCARPLDWMLERVPKNYFRPSQPTTTGEPLEPGAIAAALPELARERRLAPMYAADSLAWYFRRARADGTLSRVLVRDPSGKVLGWYIDHRGRDGTAQLLQLVAPASAARAVLDHLLHDAWQTGMTVLRGRLDPALAQSYSDRYCMFSRRGPWLLVHARDPEIRHAFHRGDALFSRLDGEWCARFTAAA